MEVHLEKSWKDQTSRGKARSDYARLTRQPREIEVVRAEYGRETRVLVWACTDEEVGH